MNYAQLKHRLLQPPPTVLDHAVPRSWPPLEPPTEPMWERHIAQHPAAIRTLVERLPAMQQVACASVAARMTLSWFERWTEVAVYAIHAEIARCVELALTAVPTVDALKRAPRDALDLVEAWLGLAEPRQQARTLPLAEAAERANLAGCAVAYDDYEEPAREVAFACAKLAEAAAAPSRYACADAIGSVASAVVRRHRKQLALQAEQQEEAEGDAESRRRGAGGSAITGRASEYAYLSAFLTRWWVRCRQRLAIRDALSAELR